MADGAMEAAARSDLLRERRAIALFEAALDLPSAERAAFVSREAGADPELVARATSMIEADRRALLRTGAASEAAGEALPPPERIGAYRVAEAIGHGGMGTVYRATRETGDFDHVVAIKLIKPGLLSQSLVERFRGERRVLAGLIHPNIARLYDGGETEDGTPFFIMEHVDGVPLLRWVEAEAPSTTERTRLFLEICDAVAFAHRGLIVHRDLTPSNVLVTREGTAKLIDFGIARLVEEPDPLREKPSIASLSLTPGYAAPERMTGAPVGTAADVYSLGKILDKLIPAADPELAAIIARASAPEAAERYPTVDALAADITAWRDGFPVAAFPSARFYKARKFLGRHGPATGAGAVALTLLLATLVWALVAESRAEAARGEAEARFADVHSLAGYMLFDLNEQIGRVPGNTAARAALADRAEGYLSALAAAPGAAPALRLETARGLIRLAELQGVPTGPNLGEHAKAMASLDKADALLAELPPSPDVAAAQALAMAYRSLVSHHGEGEGAAADALLDRALATLDAVPPDDRTAAWFDAMRDLRLAQLDFADTAGEPARMSAILAAAAQDRRGWPQGMAGSFEARADDAAYLYYRALVVDAGPKGDGNGDHEAAYGLHLEAERAFDALLRERPDDPRLLFRAAWNLIDGYVAESRSLEDPSLRMLNRGDALVERLAIIDDRDDSVRALRANIKEALAQGLRDHERYDEAIAQQRKVIEIRRAGLPDDERAMPGNLGFSQMILGIIARDAGNRPLACESWSQALASMRRADRAGRIIGYHAGFVPGLERHVEACATGVSIDFPMR